jgi:uncharacterized protein (DUF924 family)
MANAEAAFDPSAIVEFWRQAGPQAWFSKDDAFDARFREKFSSAHEAAAAGKLDGWLEAPESALALLLLLDQFPRNCFRGSPRMYATDAMARERADRALALGHDQAVSAELRLFFYLPFGHSEQLADQERAVALTEPLGPDIAKHAYGHRDIVKRFGRFPHRNALLGRESTAEELQFLSEGGFSG